MAAEALVDLSGIGSPPSSPSSASDTGSDPHPVWLHFTAGTTHNICKVRACGQRIKVQKKKQTSNMRSHLKDVHNINLPRVGRRGGKPSDPRSMSHASITAYLTPSLSSSSPSSSHPSPSSQQKRRWTLMLLRMAVEMNVSLRGVTECEVMRQFMREELGWEMPRRNTLRRLLPTYYSHLLSKLKTQLSSVDSISITTDSTFLTRQQVPYISVTGHWIDKSFTLHNTVLAVFLAEQSETADYIANSLRDILQGRLGLSDKVHCVVTDEGKNFLSAASDLKTAEIVRESLRCACHRIQLTIKKAVLHAECKPLRDLLEKCSKITFQFKNGWMSKKRDILRRHQDIYIQQLRAHVLRLQTEVAHSTRHLASAAEAEQRELQTAEEYFEKDRNQRILERKEEEIVNQEVTDLSLARGDELGESAADDSELDEESTPDPASDTDTENADETAIIQSQNAKKTETAAEVREMVDFIFRKRALIQKATTRWLTYVSVVEHVLIWKAPLMRALEEIRAGKGNKKKKDSDVDIDSLKLSDEESKILGQFLTIGLAAKHVLQAVEGGNFTTIGSLLWHHSRLQRYLEKSAEDENLQPIVRLFCRKALENSKVKFTAGVDNAAMIATLLDPRFRSLSFLSNTEAGKCKDALKDAFVDLELRMEEVNQIAVPPPAKKQKWNEFGSDILDSVSPVKQVVKSELERYLVLPDEDRKTDALSWWKLHAAQFPKVAILARRYLAIPASSAASERLFSRLKLTASASRQNMSPETACMLLFVESHLKEL